MKQSELTRLTYVTTHDLANWQRRGIIFADTLPKTRAGSERRFTIDDRGLLCFLAFLKALTSVGFPVARAHPLAIHWANGAMSGEFERFCAFNPRSHADSDTISIHSCRGWSYFDDPGQINFKLMSEELPDCDTPGWVLTENDAPKEFYGSSLIIIDRLEIVRRIDEAFEAETRKESQRVSP